MLAMLQSRLELSVPCGDPGAVHALPWHGNGEGANQQENLAAAHAAACRRVADLEAAVATLEVSTVRCYSSPIKRLRHGLCKVHDGIFVCLRHLTESSIWLAGRQRQAAAAV